MGERKSRTERDTMGEIEVPAGAYYGASTARAIRNFPVSGRPMPRRFLAALGRIKEAAAEVNADLGLLDPSLARAIAQAAAEVAEGTRDADFPVDVFQTGSGTSTNMNALLGDGVMAAVGWAIKRLHPALPVVCVVHGLDLTHRGSLYQWLWVRRFLPNLDHLVAVSRSTRAIAVAKGIAAERMSVIANGISPQPEGRRYGRHDLARLLGEPLGEGGILVTLGRLVRRKGVGWFIEQVVTRLPPATWYLVAGAGPEQRTIERALLALPAGHRVRLLGAVDEAQKTILLDAADLFVQPNVPVERDVEGFGIAVLEAGLRGLPVIASALEGLVDAVVEGENGWLVPPGDAQGFADVIGQRLSDRDALRAFGERGRRYVRDRFSWRTIVAQYASLLTRLAQQGT